MYKHVRNLGTLLDRWFTEPSILPAAPPEPAPAGSPEPRGSLTCGFCSAALTPRGEVIKLSDRAKALRDFEDDLGDARRDIAERDATIDTLTAKLAGVERELAALQAEKKQKKGFWS